jgi:hypothetical protein
MNPSTEKKQSHPIIKSEPQDDDEDLWKHTAALPGSPLRLKSTDLHPPASSTQEASTLSDSIEVAVAPPPRPATISALMANSRKRRDMLDRRPSTSTSPFEASASMGTMDEAARKLAEMELYEFKDSSSSPALSSEGQDGAAPASKVKKIGGAASRRHSSVGKEGSLGAVRVGSAVESNLGQRSVEGKGERVAGRRRSMMI